MTSPPFHAAGANPNQVLPANGIGGAEENENGNGNGAYQAPVGQMEVDGVDNEADFMNADEEEEEQEDDDGFIDGEVSQIKSIRSGVDGIYP